MSYTMKFVIFVVRSQNEKNVVATSMASIQSLSTQQKQVDKVVEE